MVKMRNTPCVKCSWKYEGFHICVIDLRTKQGVLAATTVDYAPPVKAKRKRRDDQAEGGSEEHRRRIAEGVRAARANDPGRQERDKEFIRLYNMHNSLRRIAQLTGASFITVKKVIDAAAERGDVVLNTPSLTRSRQAVG